MLPTNWVWSTLGEIGHYYNGRGFKKSEWSDRGRPIIRIQDLTGSGGTPNYFEGDVDPKHEIKDGDLLVSWAATLGAYVWRGAQAVLNQHIFKVESLVHQPFHYYLTLWVLADLYRQSHGSGMVHVTKGRFEETRIPLPPLPEQQRIVDAIETQLTRLDAAVEALKRIKANLKRYRASVLKAACEGRLVPTEAELARTEGREYETGEKLLQRILKERRERWEAEELAKLRAKGREPEDDRWKVRYKEPLAPDTSDLPPPPEGWVWASLGQAFGVYVGATPSRRRDEYWGGEAPWVSSGEVGFCRIRATRERITQEGLANTSTRMHPPGTVLLGMIGEGRTRGQAAILDIKACNNQNAAAIRVSEAGLPPDFIYRWLEGEYRNTRRLGSGNNQPALNRTRVQAMMFPLGPLPEQERIVAETERRVSQIDNLESVTNASLQRADRVRQAVLKRAFEGRLTPQDPDDEPASVLLQRIRAERAARPKRPRKTRRRTGREAPA